MLDCWHQQPVSRPTFTELVADLDRILALSSQEVRLAFSVYLKHGPDVNGYQVSVGKGKFKSLFLLVVGATVAEW